MVNIMVVEDEAAIATLLEYNLQAAKYEVEIINHGESARQRLLETVPDLLLLDWMLPGISGIELCRQLRKNKNTKSMPIIMLTARGEESERVRGLAIGADDYITKPFSVPELMARIESLLRRSNPGYSTDILEFAGILLDKSNHRATRNGRHLRLGPTEFRLLKYLMQTPGRVYSRAQLLDQVWGEDNYVDERTVDVQIGRLRKALSRGKEQDPIRTVRGAGYSLNEKMHP